MFFCRKNLINQEAKFQSQLNDLSKQLSIRDAEANKLKFQMEELQRDVFAKSAGVDSEYNNMFIRTPCIFSSFFTIKLTQ